MNESPCNSIFKFENAKLNWEDVENVWEKGMIRERNRKFFFAPRLEIILVLN